MLQLIAERGYDSVTLADIAAGAGVGRTAVYNHFPDKESVLLAMAQDQTADYLVRLRAEMEHDETPVARLRTFLRLQMTELAGHHMRMAGIGTALTAEGRTRMREHIQPMMEILGDILKDAIAAEEIPQQDVSSISMFISTLTASRFTVGLKGEELDRAIAAATAFVLRGIGVREGALGGDGAADGATCDGATRDAAAGVGLDGNVGVGGDGDVAGNGGATVSGATVSAASVSAADVAAADRSLQE